MRLLTKCFAVLCLVALAACSRTVPKDPEVRRCFTPGQNCTQFVVDAIGMAQQEVLVQAYGFTSPPILAALAKAKRGGKEVRVMLDKSNEQKRYCGATYMQHNGVPVLIDHTVDTAHNKVLIIDRRHVLTGSFNFTERAQKRNAENMVLFVNYLNLAKDYVDNWNMRAALSREYIQPDGQHCPRQP